MDNKISLDVFEKAPIPQAVLKNAVPAMAAMLMVLIYNLADTFFIGQTHNDILVAAVSLATPVFLIFMAIGTIFVQKFVCGYGYKIDLHTLCGFNHSNFS